MFCLGGAEKCGGTFQTHVSDNVLTASTVLCGHPKPSVMWLFYNKWISKTTIVKAIGKDRYQYKMTKILIPNDCGKYVTYQTADINPQKVTSKHKIDFDCKFNFYIYNTDG